MLTAYVQTHRSPCFLIVSTTSVNQLTILIATHALAVIQLWVTTKHVLEFGSARPWAEFLLGSYRS